MSLVSEPLVSIVTPVYNGGKYLPECIESVLSQTYENWEYIIVNNCSKDDSLRIAEGYAKKEPRIRIYNNAEFLTMVQNFNHSLLRISPVSKYCKVLHADDMLLPECITEMVALSEDNPSVGIVGSYVLEGVRVKCDGLPYSNSVFSGRTICRLTLLDKSPVQGGLYVFGSPTSLLIRSDLIRSRDPFYDAGYLQVVDQEVCYYLLQNTDFGFVHKVLTYTRVHTKSTTASISMLNRRILEELMLLVEYGHVYLINDEFESCLAQRMDKYYRFLASSVFEKKDKEFWVFHKEGLQRLGLPLSWARLSKGTLREFVRKITRSSLRLRKTSKGLNKSSKNQPQTIN